MLGAHDGRGCEVDSDTDIFYGRNANLSVLPLSKHPQLSL